MADRFAIDPAFPKYNDVVEHHQLFIHSVNAHFDGPEDRYQGITKGELDRLERNAHSRLEQQSTLALLACLEAYFRVDFTNRKRKNLKDFLSRSLINVFNRKARRAKLMEDIVKGWLKAGALSHAEYDRIDKAFAFRHWLAHGQYWPLKGKAATADFYEIATLVEGVTNTSSFHLDAPLPA